MLDGLGDADVVHDTTRPILALFAELLHGLLGLVRVRSITLATLAFCHGASQQVAGALSADASRSRGVSEEL